MGFSRQEYCSGLPCPPPGDLPNPEIKPEPHVSCIGRSVFYLWHHLGSPKVVLLLLLSRFSRVRLCVTPQTAAHQAPPSLGFSRQEHWSGLPFLLQCRKVKSESEVAQSCPTLSDPMDCSPPGSSIHGIFQARVLEWGAIAMLI